MICLGVLIQVFVLVANWGGMTLFLKVQIMTSLAMCLFLILVKLIPDKAYRVMRDRHLRRPWRLR